LGDKRVVFTNTNQFVSDHYKPIPASKNIPEWYKLQESFLDGNNKKAPFPEDGHTTLATIKKCMPIFDALSCGYLLVTSCDISVSQVDGEPYYTWVTSDYDAIQFHPIKQASNYPVKNATSALPKWVNPWGIKTPKGYSVLITAPFHRNNVFEAMPAVIDTDRYDVPANIVFQLSDIKFEGLVPAGTPIAQVIPFKRDSWSMDLGGEKDLQEKDNNIKLLNSLFYDKYKIFFRQKKEYK
jgi:hypothetical protein